MVLTVDLPTLIIAGLATWRISHALIFEDCMFGVCTKIRSWVVQDGLGSSFLMQLFSCIYCLSFWVGLLVTVMVLSNLTIILCPLAYSSAAILVGRYVAGQNNNRNH